MSVFQANSSEILILLSTLIVVLILLGTFRGKKKQSAPPRDTQASAKAKKPTLGPLNIPGLSTYDRDVLGRLSWLFRNPGSTNKIVSDEEMFLKAAKRALTEGIATGDELRALAGHLGFDPYTLNN